LKADVGNVLTLIGLKLKIVAYFEAQENEVPYFLVELEYRDGDAINMLRPTHRDHIERLFNQQKVASAGRFADNSGSVFLYKVEVEAELLPLIESDPYLQHKAAVIRSVREFEPGIASAIEYVRR
jgi:uncharacterized protein